MMNDELNPQDTHVSADPTQRLSSLSAVPKGARTFNARYSVFIRRARIILPLAALSIIAIVFTWNMMGKDAIAPRPAETKDGQSITKNELLNPRFDSVDADGQPYSITAAKAVQGENDDKVILLEKPLADLTTKGGSWLAIDADNGAYNQQSQHLLLKGNVNLYHDQGYNLKTAELDVDMDKEYAWSNKAVQAQGPMGLLDAQGLKADAKAKTLIFNGPAKLVLFDVGTTNFKAQGAVQE